MRRALNLAVWSLLGLGVLLFVANAWDLVHRGAPGDYVEGVVLSAELDVAAGQSPYDRQAWTQPPYQIHLYGPVFYGLAGVALRLGGGAPRLGPGRLLSLAGCLLALAAAWSLARRAVDCRRADAWFGTLVPLSFLPVLIFGPQNRVDALAVGVSLAGLALAVRSDRRALLGAAGLFVIALYTKPTALAAPAAAFLWLLWSRRFRDAALLVATAAAFGLAALGLLQLWTHGAFAAAVFGFNGANPFSLGGFFKAMQAALGQPLLPIAAGLALGGLLAGRATEKLLSGYFLLALLLAVATVGKVGANVNYFLEPGIAAAPLAAIAWWRFRAQPRAVALVLALLAAGLVVTAPRVAWELRGRTERLAAERALRPLLAGRSALTTEVGSVLAAGGQPYLNDPFIFACLAAVKRWDESRMLADLERGAIDVVVADADLAAPEPEHSNWSPAVRAAVARRYVLERVLGRNLFVYLPRGGPG